MKFTVRFTTVLVALAAVIFAAVPTRTEAAGYIECPEIVPLDTVLSLMMTGDTCDNNAYGYALIVIPTSRLGSVSTMMQTTPEGPKRFLVFFLDTEDLVSAQQVSGGKRVYFSVLLFPSQNDRQMMETLAFEKFNPSNLEIVALAWSSYKWENTDGSISLQIQAVPLYLR